MTGATDHLDDLIAYLAASPSPYHAVAAAVTRLEQAGFTRLEEVDAWDGEAVVGRRYLVRGGTLVAWHCPDGLPAQAPYRIVGTHTDSPNLRVKPRPDTGAAGWRQVAVEVYGGPLLNSWLDRDLGLSGRLALRDGRTVLVHLDEPLLRVPQLAIHLDREVNEGLRLDRQRHMTPVWGLGQVRDGALVDRVAAAAGVEGGDVLGWDLMTHDVQPPSTLGSDRELLAAPRLDNLLSTHAGVRALVRAADTGADAVQVLAAFDHEEVGSVSDSGAASPVLGTVLQRLAAARGGSAEDLARSLAASVCCSSDMGHAVHPNFVDKHEPGHHPVPNGGPILKVNASQRYATDAGGRAVFAGACERAEVPWQPFVSNNAVPCGSTIGPITAGRLGIRTVDVGVAALSMHSARELCGAEDPGLLTGALAAFLVT